jgi:hypothetical protein
MVYTQFATHVPQALLSVCGRLSPTEGVESQRVSPLHPCLNSGLLALRGPWRL